MGPFSAGVKGSQDMAHCLSIDAARDHPWSRRHLGGHVEGANVGRLGNDARALLEQNTMARAGLR